MTTMTTATMTARQGDALRRALYDADAEASIDEYSGRAMYGAQCLGIVTDRNPVAVMMRVVLGLWDCGEDDLAVWLAERDCRLDSMGLGTVIYWPGIALPDGFVTDDADGEDDL